MNHTASQTAVATRSSDNCRIVGSDLRAWYRVWTDNGQTGSLSIALLCGIQIRMVVGFAKIIEESLVAEACNAPNALVIPFRIELFRPAA